MGRISRHSGRRAGESLGAQPVLVLLAVAFGAAAVYLLALVVGTPPNNWDSLSYHLTRAALWRQEGAVGAIEDAYDDRLQSNPPNAEIVLTFLLEVARHERAAGLSQFAAWLT